MAGAKVMSHIPLFAVLAAAAVTTVASSDVANPPICHTNDYLDQYGVCQDCPANATSLEGTVGIENCKCKRNFWMDTTTYTCIPCESDKVSPYGSTQASACSCNIDHYESGGVCMDCPSRSQSQVGADEREDCKCNSGTYREGNPTDFVCTQCPQHSWSAINSQGPDQCYCDAGMYMDPTHTSCVPCPSGSTSPMGSMSISECSCAANSYIDTVAKVCITCPPNSTSLDASVNIADCTCPPNKWLNTTSKLCQSCPAGLTSNEGSKDLADCNCGTTGYLDTGTCQSCPAGSTNYNGNPGITSCLCPANQYLDLTTKTCKSCPTGATSSEGSIGQNMCGCPAGTYANEAFTNCETCPPFSFTNITVLQANGKAAANNITDCTCYTHRILDTNTKTCNLTCPPNSYPDELGTKCIFCDEDQYLNNMVCMKCPFYSTSPAASGAITDCTCLPGTYWEPESMTCKPCGKGHFCPGNGTRIECNAALPNDSQQCNVPLSTLTEFSPSIGECGCWAQECRNGVREVGEECDDGNVFEGDGCNNNCKLDDPSQTKWLCDTTMGQLTTCCAALTNPITGTKNCSCVGQEATVPGTIVTPSCELLDIDECVATNGLCHPNAVCENLDAREGHGGHNCLCPPGMVGDAITTCDVYTYTTTFEVAIADTPQISFDVNAFVANLYTWGTLPGSISTSRVNITLDDYSPAVPTRRRNLLQDSVDPDGTTAGDSASDSVETPATASDSVETPTPGDVMETEAPTPCDDEPPGASRRLLSTQPPRKDKPEGASRRLLATGTLVTVYITSGTQQQMEDALLSVNMATLPTQYVVIMEPQNQIVTIDTAFTPVTTSLTGMIVDGITFDDNANIRSWIIDARYESAPNTITAMYISRAGGLPPYSNVVKNSFYVSQHPCASSISVCCLTEFRDEYYTGLFGQNVTDIVGTCPVSIQKQHTLNMFDVARNEEYVENLFMGFPNSTVSRVTPEQIQLFVSEDDLRTSFATREDLGSEGYKLKFFLGMSFITLLPANAISTVNTQTQINIHVTSSLTFSFASEQDYTFVQYITLGLFQNKWVDGLIERQMQFVKLGVVLPQGFQQNMDSGLVPLGSLRFAVAQTLPPDGDAAWINPCLSSDNSGMWDIANPWRQQYAQAAAQPCATQHNMCSNPVTRLLVSNLVEFYFPIGDGTIGPTQFSSGGWNLYVYFDLSVVDSYGVTSVTKLFAQAAIGELSVARSCESLSATASLLQTTSIDLAIGLVGNEKDWQSSVAKFPDVKTTSSTEGLADTTESVKARSLASGLINLVIRGDPVIFRKAYAKEFSLEIEHMTSFHFLDGSKFDQVRNMLRNGEAYSVFTDAVTGFQKIQVSQGVAEICTGGNGGLFSCAIRHDIAQRKILSPTSVHSLASSFGTTDPMASRDWITSNLLGVSEFSNELATNHTNLVRSKYSVDDRVNKAWYISPGYNWPTVPGAPPQSSLRLSDKLICTAVVVLADRAGKVVRRRLLTLESKGENSEPIVTEKPLKSAPGTMGKKSTTVHRETMSALRSRTDRRSWRTLRMLGMATNSPLPKRRSTQSMPEKNKGIMRRMHRRSLPYLPKSDDEKIQSAMKKLTETPLSGSVPPIDYGVEVDVEMAGILNLPPKQSAMIDIDLAGRFPEGMTDSEVQKEFISRLQHNIKRFCNTCTQLYSVFWNVGRVARGRRRLLSLDSSSSVDYNGPATVMISFNQEHDNQISYEEIFRSLLDVGYTDVFTGDLSDPQNIQNYITGMKDNQWVVQGIHRTYDTYNTTQVVLHKASGSGAGGGDASWGGSTSSSSTISTGTHDSSSSQDPHSLLGHPNVSKTSNAPPALYYDPRFFAFIFVIASIIMSN